MILGYHIVFCAYGFWLPNDPRGSWSDFVGAWELLRFGRATTVNVRRSVAHAAHDRAARAAAKAALKYPPVHLTGEQALRAAQAFADHAAQRYPILALAVLPEHIHAVIGRPGMKVEQLVNLWKGAATRAWNQRGIHPMQRYTASGHRPPRPWARGEWKVYLNTPADITRSIHYVNANPPREHKPPQHWSFVTPHV